MKNSLFFVALISLIISNATFAASIFEPLITSGIESFEELQNYAVLACETKGSKEGLSPGKALVSGNYQVKKIRGLTFQASKVDSQDINDVIDYFNQNVKTVIIICERPALN
jgi:hypothetical protein